MEAVLKKHWEHSRHCESQILWFTNIYAIVIAAILVFIGEASSAKEPDLGLIVLLAFFGFVLSVIGFLIVVALSLGHQNYIMNIVVVLDHWEAKEFYKDYAKPLHYKIVHRWFFEIIIALFGVLSLHYVSKTRTSPEILQNPWILLIAAFIIIGIIKALFRLTLQTAFDSRKQFKKEKHGEFWENVPYKGSWISRLFPLIYKYYQEKWKPVGEGNQSEKYK